VNIKVTLKDNKKINALVVEDDLDSLDILLHILNSDGNINTESARTGEQAIDFYKKNMPSITFLDIDIPAPDGLETLKAIKKIDPTAKVVMVTGCSEIVTVKKAVSLGAFGYVVKPFVPEKILSLIKKLNH
jgi:DNA-binding NtrC family response regulator